MSSEARSEGVVYEDETFRLVQCESCPIPGYPILELRTALDEDI